MPKATQTILSYIRESDKSKVLKRITEMEIIHITKNIEKNSKWIFHNPSLDAIPVSNSPEASRFSLEIYPNTWMESFGAAHCTNFQPIAKLTAKLLTDLENKKCFW